MHYPYLLLLLLSLNATAQNCESVIALSKTTNSTVYDQDSIAQQAANFCSDYKQSRQSGNAMDAGGSYGLFSATVGMSSQSADAVASKFCSASDNFAVSKTAYRNYVESISDKAYAAYSSCLSLSRSDVKFAVDTAAILPDEFSISAGLVSTTGKTKTTIDISASSGIVCTNGGQSVTTVDIANGKSVSITCRRTDSKRPGFVKFLNTGIGINEQMTVPWAGLDEAVVNSAYGTIGLRAVGTRATTDTSRCPANSDANRGELAGRVNFAKPFKEPPSVSIAINSVDSGIPADTGMRLTIAVTGIDKNGFGYSFRTWCNTTLTSASANWLAVSR